MESLQPLSPPRLAGDVPSEASLTAEQQKLLASSCTWVIYDLEWTTWEGTLQRSWSDPGEELEIVQIGACKVDARQGLCEIESLSILVKPALNSTLSAYFTNLTGITQKEVDELGVPFPEALDSFRKFAGVGTPLLSWGTFGINEGDAITAPALLAGDAYVLDRNQRLHNCGTESWSSRGLDARSVLLAAGMTEATNLNSGRAHELAGPQGAEDLAALGGGAGGRHDQHDALWDARSIACAYRACAKAGHFNFLLND
eukprot:gnl/MRDRNA2_/MRDRNA2_162136_c0_seq1.p1 gnl/MRDRNA2_/MRDRNA2_162136_c0~~gnl/MRDRNA2_/MRDRNA2_162136_c0_seq1.p1  ORF type:complete len:284 (+),score=57.11 gnl/MRDRNA2_/MRDRNA2_162136_c0_seq1:82-852(+)